MVRFGSVVVLSSFVEVCRVGASGVGELLANTLAVRNVTVVVLDVKPIVTENCASEGLGFEALEAHCI